MLAKDERAAAASGKGCLGRAADDEPVFVLRGQDLLAPDLIALWADRAHLAGAPDDKVTDAVVLAEQMREWQRANRSKVPD